PGSPRGRRGRASRGGWPGPGCSASAPGGSVRPPAVRCSPPCRPRRPPRAAPCSTCSTRSGRPWGSRSARCWSPARSRRSRASGRRSRSSRSRSSVGWGRAPGCPAAHPPRRPSRWGPAPESTCRGSQRACPRRRGVAGSRVRVRRTRGDRVTLHSSHWGNFEAVATDTGLDVRPDPVDPDPALPLLRNVPAMLDERVRVLVPHVRRGFLERGAGPDERRGRDDYVPVSWERAVALAAGELERVRTEHGNASIFGGSYGWASAGRFHHAQSQVHRFLGVLGGYTRSVETYSLGAARPLLRRIVGNDDPISRPTTLPVLAEHTELFVCFGGIPAKNAHVNPGGIARHTTVGHLRRARERGARFVLVSPLRDDLVADLDAEWIVPVPGTDTALMLGL